jgi:hypothetical protein
MIVVVFAFPIPMLLADAPVVVFVAFYQKTPELCATRAGTKPWVFSNGYAQNTAVLGLKSPIVALTFTSDSLIIFVQSMPLNSCICPAVPQSIQYMIKPTGRVVARKTGIKSPCAPVMRGDNKPWVVKLIASAEPASGVLVPIPT